MKDEPPVGFDSDEGKIIAFRHPVSGAPIPIPRELAIAESRPFKAYSDHLSGMKWELIAEKYEYADARAAQYDIGRYVETARSLYNSFTAAQAKSIARARYEALLHATWEGALNKNPVMLALAKGLVADIVKLDKLDEVTEEEAGGPKTVVVYAEDESTYVAELEGMSKD